MKIQIAGPGCGRCLATEKIAREVCAELDIGAEIEHVYDIRDYSKLGVQLTPAVLADGKIIFSGRVPTNDELQKAITEII